jgi:hypothetical protein
MPTSTRTRSSWAGQHGGPGPASGATAPTGSSAIYRPRRPTATPLYPVVQHHLETFLATAAEEDPLGDSPPAWVERDFRAYLKCGILAHGFARIRCGDCGHERFLAFSCKGRGFCPSCNARRMAEVAAHLTDQVFPWLPVRQWVLSVPKRLRPYLHYKPEVATGVLHVFLRAIRSTLRTTSPGAPGSVQDVKLGAVSFLHRFGATLNAHFHFHVLVLDGVFCEDGHGQVQFHEAACLQPRDWERLQVTVQHRVLRYFRRHGLLDEEVTEDVLTWQATGGFSIDASVRIEGSDRYGLERLARYCARPPFALERLHAPDGQPSLRSPNGRLIYRLPGPTPDGRTLLVLSPLELLQRLARFVPPPRMHRHRHHGVLAPNAKWRGRVTALGRPEPDEPASQHPDVPPHPADSQAPLATPPNRTLSTPRSARIRWAQLLARIYELLPLLCPACGGEMKIISFLTDPPTVQAILRHLDLPHRLPPLAPARAPPQVELTFDQTPAIDPAVPDPVPEFVFDQSLPEEFED